LQERIFEYNRTPALQQADRESGICHDGFPRNMVKAHERREHDRTELAEETLQSEK
jgi:hypothetical protein